MGGEDTAGNLSQDWVGGEEDGILTIRTNGKQRENRLREGSKVKPMFSSSVKTDQDTNRGEKKRWRLYTGHWHHWLPRAAVYREGAGEGGRGGKRVTDQ